MRKSYSGISRNTLVFEKRDRTYTARRRKNQIKQRSDAGTLRGWAFLATQPKEFDFGKRKNNGIKCYLTTFQAGALAHREPSLSKERQAFAKCQHLLSLTESENSLFYSIPAKDACSIKMCQGSESKERMMKEAGLKETKDTQQLNAKDNLGLGPGGKLLLLRTLLGNLNMDCGLDNNIL